MCFNSTEAWGFRVQELGVGAEGLGSGFGD